MTAPPAPSESAGRRGQDVAVVRHLLIAIGLVALALAVWQAATMLLLLFGAVLLAIILRGVALRLQRLVRMPDKLAVGVVILALAALVVGAGWLMGSTLSQQFGQLAQQVPASVDRLEQLLSRTGWGRQIIDQVRAQTEGSGSGPGVQQLGNVLGWLRTVFASILNGAGYVVVIVLAAVYLALQPDLYRHGLRLLMPQSVADPLDEALDATQRALWGWSIGQVVQMVLVGVLTALGLWALGVPAWAALGVLAGLLEFIPFFGPILAAVPAVLLALTVEPTLALWTAGFYLILQQVEGNVLVPVIQRRAVSLPPVVTLFAILVFGVLFGIPGAIFAVPLAVAVMVLVRELYVKDTLGKPVERDGAR